MLYRSIAQILWLGSAYDRTSTRTGGLYCCVVLAEEATLSPEQVRLLDHSLLKYLGFYIPPDAQHLYVFYCHENTESFLRPNWVYKCSPEGLSLGIVSKKFRALFCLIFS